MNKEFTSHMLNEAGKAKANAIAEAFDRLLVTLTTPATPDDATVLCPPGREVSLVRTKLEEACFFAKKAMAVQRENQQSWPFAEMMTDEDRLRMTEGSGAALARSMGTGAGGVVAIGGPNYVPPKP